MTESGLAPEPSLPARRRRGGFLLAWMPPVIGCFLPLAFGISPAAAAKELIPLLGEPIVGELVFMDRPMQVLLLSLALGTCSILLTLPWRLAFGWRNPGSKATRVSGRVLLGLLAVVNALAVGVLVLGVLRGDDSMTAPLVGQLVGFASLGILLMPRWRSLSPATRLLGALDAGYLGSVLAALAITADNPTPGWWLLAWGSLVAAVEIASLPKLE